MPLNHVKSRRVGLGQDLQQQVGLHFIEVADLHRA